ncbi:hypothetical protein Tco_1248201, partial [Tanacetum coccineum]
MAKPLPVCGCIATVALFHKIIMVFPRRGDGTDAFLAIEVLFASPKANGIEPQFKVSDVVYIRKSCKTKALPLTMLNGKNGFLANPTCCNGKVYAFTRAYYLRVVEVEIMVKKNKVLISLSPFVEQPEYLFYIEINFDDETRKTVASVYLFKLDMTSMKWEEIQDLKDAIFFIELASHEDQLFYQPGITSELGESDHFDFKQQEEKEDPIVIRLVTCDLVEYDSSTSESNLLNSLIHILEMIMELCIGVEYMNFRATCKRCNLAAPSLQWSNKTVLRRLQTYSLVSPWLMVFDKHLGIIAFTDPLSGDKYFKKTPQELIGFQIYCS